MTKRSCNHCECKKDEDPAFACPKCNIPFCSAKCQSSDSWHTYFCAKSEAKKEKLLAEEATKQTKKEQNKKKPKEANKKPLPKGEPNEEPQVYVKPFGSHQNRESQIYSILEKSIDTYRNFCKVLPGSGGLQFPMCDRLDPPSENIESTYVELVELLNQIHAVGVVCGDLKSEHVRIRNGKPIIIDFDHARLAAGGSIGGITLASWCSVDQLANQPGDFVDDLEAACKIAKCWAAEDSEEKFLHQRQAMCKGVGYLVSLLNDSASWLDHHLRYVVSLPRGAGHCAATYANLLRGSNFKFTVADFQADFNRRSRDVRLHKREQRGDSVDNFKGRLTEQLVGGQLANLFVPDSRINMDHFFPNQTFFDTGENREVTEWGFVVRKHQNFLPTPNNSLTECYPHAAGGEHLVVEVWYDTKTLPDLCTKLNVLFTSHRPIHTLYHFAWLCLVCGGSLTSDEKEIQMAGTDLLAVCLNKRAIDLSVLIAAGRVSFFPLEGFSVKALSSRSALTLPEYAEEIKTLKHQNAILTEQNAILTERVNTLASQVQQLLLFINGQPPFGRLPTTPFGRLSPNIGCPTQDEPGRWTAVNSEKCL